MPTKCGLNGGKDAGVNGQLSIPMIGHEYFPIPREKQYQVRFNSGGANISQGTVVARRCDGLWLTVIWSWKGETKESRVPSQNCKKVKIDGGKNNA